MKKFLTFFVILAIGVTSAGAAVHVRGHSNKKTGTYTQSHYRSSPDKSKHNNYSTKGNTNPHTGKKGTKKAN